MKYYTKEWYELMQQWGFGDGFRKIPDKAYTDADIKALYDKELKKAISRDRKDHNTPPQLFLPDFSDEEFLPEDWLIVDDDGKEHIPSSPEDVLENIMAEHSRALEEFEQRPPFDPAESADMFRIGYRAGLRNARYFFPEWLRMEVDPRLIALEMLPESSYKKYRKWVKEAERRWESINRAAEKEGKKQDISDDVRGYFDLHDSCLLQMRMRKNDLVLHFRKDGMWSDGDGYRELRFKDAEILEKDKGISTRKIYDEYGIWTNTSFLYNELYRTESADAVSAGKTARGFGRAARGMKQGKGYEVHIMFWTGIGLAYLTVRCADIKSKDSAAFKG